MQNRRKIVTCFAVVAVALLVSCMPAYSVHPYFTEKDLIFDPSLVGTWYSQDDENQRGAVVIEQMDFNGKPGYEISLTNITDKPATPEINQKFDARLFKLGGEQFLDVVQSDLRSGDDQIAVLAMPVHMLAKVSLQEDSLTFWFLDDEWLKKSLESGQTSTAHEIEDDTPVLTAPTADLQKFVLDHANEEKAFSFEAGPFQRKK